MGCRSYPGDPIDATAFHVISILFAGPRATDLTRIHEKLSQKAGGSRDFRPCLGVVWTVKGMVCSGLHLRRPLAGLRCRASGSQRGPEPRVSGYHMPWPSKLWCSSIKSGPRDGLEPRGRRMASQAR